MLNIAASAFKCSLQMPYILGPENAFDATEALAFTSAQKRMHFLRRRLARLGKTKDKQEADSDGSRPTTSHRPMVPRPGKST